MGAGMAVDRAGPEAFDMSRYAELVRYALLQDVRRFSRLFEPKYAPLQVSRASFLNEFRKLTVSQRTLVPTAERLHEDERLRLMHVSLSLPFPPLPSPSLTPSTVPPPPYPPCLL